MRKIVKILLNKTLIIILILISFSCQKNSNEYYIDVIGSTKLDTVFIEDNIEFNYVKDLYILENKKTKRILGILPLADSSYIMTKPRIENIYIEANNIQSNEKGIRLLIRNTDLLPDYFFIDLYHKKEWFIEYYGLINTNSMDSLYVKKVKINKTVQSEIGKEAICNPKEIIQKYFHN